MRSIKGIWFLDRWLRAVVPGCLALTLFSLTAQVIHEDFSSGMDNWWVEGGERVWVHEGRLYIHADNPKMLGGGVATVWCKTPHGPNFVLEVDAHVVSSSLDVNNINLFFSYSDPFGKPLIETRGARKTADYGLYHLLNGYIITFLNDSRGAAGSGKARIRIRRNPGFKLLAEDFRGSCRQGVTYHLRVTKRGGEITFGVNGETLLTARDPEPLGGGLFGLRTYRTNLWWDNVQLAALE
jgi:hypothetical protein